MREATAAVLLAPRWQPAALEAGAGAWVGWGSVGLCWITRSGVSLEGLSQRMPRAQWMLLSEGSAGQVGEEVFGCVQRVLQGKPKESAWLQVLLKDEQGVLGGALSGGLRTAQQETRTLSGS